MNRYPLHTDILGRYASVCIYVNAIAILKIAPEHQSAQAAIQRLLRVANLSTQNELRLAGYHAANSAAE
ncbi:MAG: hypothetical protein KDA72_12575 [Planctomycetales bacterium]|nr:hypothetical protein [Planctomycetales bacterium]